MHMVFKYILGLEQFLNRYHSLLLSGTQTDSVLKLPL